MSTWPRELFTLAQCGTCAHYAPRPRDTDLYGGPIGTCNKIDSGEFGRDPNELAYAQSYEGDGWLTTRPTFGCVLWKAKDEGEEPRP